MLQHGLPDPSTAVVHKPRTPELGEGARQRPPNDNGSGMSRSRVLLLWPSFAVLLDWRIAALIRPVSGYFVDNALIVR